MIEEPAIPLRIVPREEMLLLIEVAILRRLVWCMALAIPREQLPEDERNMLDDILTAP